MLTFAACFLLQLKHFLFFKGNRSDCFCTLCTSSRAPGDSPDEAFTNLHDSSSHNFGLLKVTQTGNKGAGSIVASRRACFISYLLDYSALGTSWKILLKIEWQWSNF